VFLSALKALRVRPKRILQSLHHVAYVACAIREGVDRSILDV